MITKKAGTILVNKESKKIALVYRKDTNDLAFPKGHLEEGETLQACAVRETEEETGRKNHLIDDKELDIVRYVTLKGKNVELHMYLAIDEGPTQKQIADKDKEKWDWFDFEEVERRIVFENLKEFWRNAKIRVKEVFNS